VRARRTEVSQLILAVLFSVLAATEPSIAKAHGKESGKISFEGLATEQILREGQPTGFGISAKESYSPVPGQPQSPGLRPQNDQAVLYIYRVQRFASRNRPVVSVNNKDVMILAPHRFVKLTLDAGPIEIRSGLEGIPGYPWTIENLDQFINGRREITSLITLDAEAGRTYYVRGEIVWGPKPALVLVADEIGAEEIKECEEMACDFSLLAEFLKVMREARGQGKKLKPIGNYRKELCRGLGG
jgi:hypothetical protein